VKKNLVCTQAISIRKCQQKHIYLTASYKKKKTNTHTHTHTKQKQTTNTKKKKKKAVISYQCLFLCQHETYIKYAHTPVLWRVGLGVLLQEHKHSTPQTRSTARDHLQAPEEDLKVLDAALEHPRSFVTRNNKKVNITEQCLGPNHIQQYYGTDHTSIQAT
jgi:hypothetical protein